MNAIIGVKELRENLGRYADEVQRGRSFTVVRRSQPLFSIVPVVDDDDGWETLIDFTQFRPGGIPAKELLKKLDRINGSH